MDLTLLVSSLLLTASCHAGLRARDPNVDEESHEFGDLEPGTSGTSGTAQFPVPHGYRHHGTAGPVQPPLGIPKGPVTPAGESAHPARTGNWCAFVHRRVMNVAVMCGTETFSERSVNPCSKGDPDCHTLQYQLSSRPVYRQKQQVFTALHWKCCPGHAGRNCEETEEESPSGQEPTGRTRTGSSRAPHSGGEDADLLEDGGWDDGPAQQIPSGPVFPVPGRPLVGTGGANPPSASLPFMDSTTLLTAHQILAAMMTQLQPVLDGFNLKLEHLSTEVKGLSEDLQKLRNKQESHTCNAGQTHTHGTIEKKLEDGFEQIHQIQAQLELQQKQIEQNIQSQQDLLQQSLSDLKEEIEHQIIQNQEDVQASLQPLTQSVEQIKLSQENLEREFAPRGRERGGLPAPSSDVWEAISRLEQKVLNNTMHLITVSENSTHLMSVAQKLDHRLQNLSLKLEKVSQSSEIHFAETGLELEAAKVTALNSVNELASNLSSQDRQLRELELYLDNIYERVQSNEPTEACNCEEVGESLITLELKLTNVTELAKKNHDALEDAEAMRGQGPWLVQVEDLHQALLSVKEALAFEQAKSRTLNDNLAQLKASLLGSQQEIVELKDSFMAKASEIKHLSSSFSSLLKDGVRHSEVLEVLLGDEVMEFSGWSESQQKELSIPTLLQKLRLMQEKIDTHEGRLASLRRNSPEGDQMTGDDPMAFSEWSLTEDHGSRQDHFLPSPSAADDDEDYTVSDFWSLGKEVEELASRLSQLELNCNCTAAPSGSVVELQREVTSLRQALENHLSTFHNLFSYTEELASSSHTLNLDQVWSMMRRKDRRRNKLEKLEKLESSSMRSKRNSGSGPSRPPVAFVATLQQRRNITSTLLHMEVDLNHGNAYRPSTGEFHAPQTGLYLFLVTLNFEKGPCLAQLKHGLVPAASLRLERGEGGLLSRTCLLELRKGDKVTLEVLKGRLGQGPLNDNKLSGILLVSTEDRDRL